MGSGKSAVGKALAGRLGVPFLDSDAEVERIAGMAVSEIFEQEGEQYFRDKEACVIAGLLEMEPGILSFGGGAWLAERNREAVSGKAASVWLRADLRLLWSRVKHKTTRPLLRTPRPRAKLKALCEERNPVYALADLAVDAQAEYSIEDMASQVIAALLTRPDILEGQP